ncbi:MAG: DNA-formamidopyrimidine glycosylase [Rhizobiales bacterium TMED249]|uniref:Formamidopyrimidine-DNA glycosylase n=1 Tax=PS1 clade bacterium TaxID=2175152 RepID=A0A368E4H6_9PROT|nr:MAG: DNA-formamidopyrimidine glycosylase [Rhizobiales bacterium TMED249]RCL78463.1 MAG: bifunctional DNA-formamidopyrimidine glycosylase/DNA-(apurinic or apyrimidinic site) lyase [PS1 clade bacterium]HAK98891.1 DNA-formamidopyrimidine glycosylase [Rhodobiaceae bacterium]HCV49076.1 DNA-formamidopyrimidine glycosylase [Rhodobiaceae bacterium]|tara:strand:- start:31667 stop:32560 length:894 start_codon:yes stop_codon:yes gene_type:complete
MPELPEVETVCRGLRAHIIDRRIVRADLRRQDLRFPFPEGLQDQLEGSTVKNITRRAKYILIQLGNDQAGEAGDKIWLTHLGMTGRFTVYPTQSDETGETARFYHSTDNQIGAHDHVHIWFDDRTELVYTDPRRFGYMDMMALTDVNESKHLRELGPEPIGDAFDSEVLLEKLKNRRSPIKSALLDQHVVAGLGNIYVCEALYRSGISPRRLACHVGPVRTGRLIEAIKNVLDEAITAGGSTLRDFAGAQGSAGYFQHNFDVYDREGEACLKPECGGKIKRLVQSGRSSFYCSKCQR